MCIDEKKNGARGGGRGGLINICLIGVWRREGLALGGAKEREGETYWVGGRVID